MENMFHYSKTDTPDAHLIAAGGIPLYPAYCVTVLGI